MWVMFLSLTIALRNSSDAGGGGVQQYCQAYAMQLRSTVVLWSLQVVPDEFASFYSNIVSIYSNKGIPFNCGSK